MSDCIPKWPFQKRTYKSQINTEEQANLWSQINYFIIINDNLNQLYTLSQKSFTNLESYNFIYPNQIPPVTTIYTRTFQTASHQSLHSADHVRMDHFLWAFIKDEVYQPQLPTDVTKLNSAVLLGCLPEHADMMKLNYSDMKFPELSQCYLFSFLL
jgi:hypothetical protein